MGNIRIDDLAAEIANELQNYGEDVANAVKIAVNDVAKKTNEVIKNHCTFGGKGNYIKSFHLKTSSTQRYNHKKIWYVKGPYYRLTHLLEKGHAKRGGGRVKAYPHIKYGEEYAIANLEGKIIEGINHVT